MSTTTQPRGDATRAGILQVARSLMSEHGYHRTGISDIQAATGLTKGAFYHHFRSKEDLALAVLEAAEADYARHLIDPVMQMATPVKRLIAYLDRIVELHGEPQWLNCRILMTLSGELTERDTRLHGAVAEMRDQMHECLVGLLRAADEVEALNAQVDPDVCAEWILCTFVGLQSVHKIGTPQVDAERIVAQIKAALIQPSALQ